MHDGRPESHDDPIESILTRWDQHYSSGPMPSAQKLVVLDSESRLRTRYIGISIAVLLGVLATVPTVWNYRAHSPNQTVANHEPDLEPTQVATQATQELQSFQEFILRDIPTWSTSHSFASHPLDDDLAQKIQQLEALAIDSQRQAIRNHIVIESIP